MLKISLLFKKFTKLFGQITQKLLGLGMRNSQAIDFVRTQTYREIFKSALVYLEDTRDLNNQTLSIKL